MQQNYNSTALPTIASQVPSGDGAAWVNPNNILLDDGNNSSVSYFQGGDNGAAITGSGFTFPLPAGAVVDGIVVYIDGQNIGCYGTISISLPGASTFKPIGPLTGNYGSSTDKWGASSINKADLASLAVTVDTGDVSGGDGFASIDVIRVTVYWHLDLATAPADVPTRLAHKVYSSTGVFLGELPNVQGPFGFNQDINGTSSDRSYLCGVTFDEAMAQLALGESEELALFKNGNRVQSWLYDYWHPNGKLMFSGQVNELSLQYGGGGGINVYVISDGIDLSNLIARGYPFAYTTDQQQTGNNGAVTIFEGDGNKGGAGFYRVGQSFRTGSGITNNGAIELLLQGSANVTVTYFDAPNGNVLGSTTKFVSAGGAQVERFEYPQLIDTLPNDDYFFGVSVAAGQSINVYRNTNSASYANGSMYEAVFSGTSGGSYGAIGGDLYFVTKTGTPTTTTVYSNSDPTSGMMHNIMLDYNARGGKVKERNFVPTGLSLTYPFNQAYIDDAGKKVLEMAPTGFYMYVDLGTAEMDIMPGNETADFTIVRGRDIGKLDLVLSIKQVKNHLLFTGGKPTGSTTNLYREYKNGASADLYGTRTVPKTDNRVVLTPTADAIGDTFIEDNSKENQSTTLTVLNAAMDITLLTPGKTIGFRDFGNIIDSMVLSIVRREYKTGYVVLTLGRLPFRQPDQIQAINRGLLNEQTIDNPSAPS